MDYALLNLGVTVAVFLATFLARKRILAALGRLLFTRAIDFARATYLVETTEDTSEGPKRVLRPSAALQSLFAGLVPTLVQTALKSVKLKPGGAVPLNLVTGQLDFMAPVLQKLAAGRKVGFEDFLPLIMEKAVPMVEQLLGGLAGAGKNPAGGTTANPFLKELQP